MNKRIITMIFTAFIVTAGLLSSCSSTKEENRTLLPGISVFLEGQEVSALFDDGEALWVGGKDGIKLLDNSSGETLAHLDAQIKMVYASDICRTADGTIWAGHNSGLTAFSPEGEMLLSLSKPELPGGRINTLLPDGDGLWVGAMEGAAYLSPENGNWVVKETLNSQNGLADDCVNVMLRLGKELWFGAYLATEKGGLSIRRDTGEWQYLSVDEGLPHRYVNALWQLSENRLLVGVGHLNMGGLAMVEKRDSSWAVTETWSYDDGIPGEKVRWLFGDSAGRVWITTESCGILLCPSVSALEVPLLDGLLITRDNGLSDNEVKTIVECEDCLWLGSRSGLTRVEKSSINGWFGN